MNQLPENSLCIYDVTLVTSYLIGLGLYVINWNKQRYDRKAQSLGFGAW